MKHLFGLCLLFITINSAAQGITYSTYEKFDPRSGDYSVVGKSGGRLYTYRSGSEGHFLDAWNDSMNRVATVILDFFPDKIYDTRFIAYPDKIIALFQVSDHGRIIQYAAMLDGAGRLQGKARQLDEIKTGIFGASGNYFSSAVSDDKRFISVYYASAKADEMRIRCLLLDDNLKTIKRSDKTYTGKGALSALPALLNNNGNFFMPVTTNTGNRNYASGIWILSLAGNAITATEYPLEGRYGAGLYFKMDNNARRIYCGGFYSDKKAGDYEGILLGQLSTDSANAVKVMQIPLDDRLRLATGERSKSKAFNDYKTRQLIIRTDGGFVIVAEDFFMSVRSGGGVAPYGYYNSYYSPYAGAQNIREYHHGDVLACSYSAEGTREWSAFIRKDQYSQEDGGIFSSYSFINTGGSLGFIYNNFDSRRSRIMLAVIDAAGNIDTQALDAGGPEDPDWLPLAGRKSLHMNLLCLVCVASRYASPKSYFSGVLHLVRANSPYTVIILFILTLGLKLQALGHPVVPAPDVQQAFFTGIVHLLKGFFGASGTAFMMLAAVCTFAQALYLRHIAIKHRLFEKPSYLPAFVYIIISSLHPALGSFSAPLLLNWVILGGLDTILGFTRREDQPRTIFNAGFLLACGALLWFPAIAYFVLLLFAMVVLRPFRPGEWIVALLGYFTPFYFAVCILYLADMLPFIRSWPHTGISLPHFVKGDVYLPGLVTGCVILLGSGIFSLSGVLHRLPVATRRGWGAVVMAGCLAVIVSILSPRTELAAWFGTAPALALLVVPTMVPEKRSRFATFAFYFLIVLVLFCQLTLRLNINS